MKHNIPGLLYFQLSPFTPCFDFNGSFAVHKAQSRTRHISRQEEQILIFSFPVNPAAPKNESLAFQIKGFSQNDFFYSLYNRRASRN